MQVKKQASKQTITYLEPVAAVTVFETRVVSGKGAAVATLRHLVGAVGVRILVRGEATGAGVCNPSIIQLVFQSIHPSVHPFNRPSTH